MMTNILTKNSKPKFLQKSIQYFMVLTNIAMVMILALAIYSQYAPHLFAIKLTPLGILFLIGFGLIFNLFMLIVLYLVVKIQHYSKLKA